MTSLGIANPLERLEPAGCIPCTTNDNQSGCKIMAAGWNYGLWRYAFGAQSAPYGAHGRTTPPGDKFFGSFLLAIALGPFSRLPLLTHLVI
jgi:hypothetical protein